MLVLLARHSLIDISVTARGDLETGSHHTVEDVGITLGQAFAKAMGDKKFAEYEKALKEMRAKSGFGGGRPGAGGPGAGGPGAATGKGAGKGRGGN
jgi:hypothetical protein